MSAYEYTKEHEAVLGCVKSLEGAGVDGSSISGLTPDRFTAGQAAAVAKLFLDHALSVFDRVAQQEMAEQEAEDAKAKAYRYAIFPTAIPWEHLDEEAREAHRVRYRAAREFFTREEIIPVEIVEPRVIHQGDGEPDRSANWKDQHNDIWAWDAEKGKWSYGCGSPRDWDTIAPLWPSAFPMTEVIDGE